MGEFPRGEKRHHPKKKKVQKAFFARKLGGFPLAAIEKAVGDRMVFMRQSFAMLLSHRQGVNLAL